jgi:transglutaminase-like putative cysteine protease
MDLCDLPNLPPDRLAVGVGCKLIYRVTNPAPALLLLQACRTLGQIVYAEDYRIGYETNFEQYFDAYGNLVRRTVLAPGDNVIRYDAIVLVPRQAEVPQPVLQIHAHKHLFPLEALRFSLPSRYCESDKLGAFASRLFGHLPYGVEMAQAICNWTHETLVYRYGSGDPSLSACEAIDRGYGVCRDFAHVMTALCRALDLPARYVAGYMPLFEASDTDIGIDFHAYVEVYISGAWHVFDPRHNRPHVGRVKIAHGLDAGDVAFATIYSRAETISFAVWSYPVDHGTVRVGDPVSMPVLHHANY